MLKRVSFALVAGVAYLLVEGVGQLIVMPVLLRNYPKVDVGLWFLINGFLVLVQVGQGGLGPVVVRAIARVSALGHWHLQSERKRTKQAYGIATLFLVMLLLLVSFYIANVAARVGFSDWLLLWVPFALGLVIRMYSWRWLHVLNGLGHVGIDKIILIFGSVSTYAGYWVIAASQLRMTNLGIYFAFVSCLMAGFSYVICQYCVRKRLRRLDKAESGTAVSVPEEIYLSQHSYWSEARKFLILNVSGFFVLNVDVFIIERMFGAQYVPGFSVLVKIGVVILSVSTLVQSICFPYVAAAWVRGEFARASRIYRVSLAVSIATAVSCGTVALVLAPILFPIWFGVGVYLGTAVFGAQLLFVLVSVHTIAQATPALATGQADFTDLAVISALLAVPFSCLLGWQFGLVGVALGNAAATIIPSALHGARAWRVFMPEVSERGKAAAI